ncbi:MAG: hypothetical protein OXC66_03400 [Roseovarius sp.]|nr:hypothetical protein [Roseovarius sp.]
MTALSKYKRLEATALWRDNPEEQRRNVIVSLGEATLIISNYQDIALSHWALAAIQRINPGEMPAIYYPEGDPGETIELEKDEMDMVEAIEKLRTAIERKRPHPGRLRFKIFILSLAGMLLFAMSWLPGAVRNHIADLIPDAKRSEMDAGLLEHIQRVTGPPCASRESQNSLFQLEKRLPGRDGPGSFVIFRDGFQGTRSLPGGTILISNSLLEDYEEPDIVAGYIVAEHIRAEVYDPIARLLKLSSIWDNLRLLTTGNLSERFLRDYAEHLLKSPELQLSAETLLHGFRTFELRSTPYAYAVDISGESTYGLIEADPFGIAAPDPVLSDAEWIRLQNICGN